jgi:hypothetical protein
MEGSGGFEVSSSAFEIVQGLKLISCKWVKRKNVPKCSERL